MIALLLVSTALVSQSQTPTFVQRAAESISPGDIRRRIGIIADDSMRGRDTPSRELDKVATYIGTEFRRFGLKPGGDRGSFLQQYPIDRVQFVAESSAVVVHANGYDAAFAYGTDVVFADNGFDSGEYAGDIVLLGGPLGGQLTVDSVALAGKMLILAVPPRNRGELQRVVAWKPQGIVFVGTAPDSVWRRNVDRSNRPQPRDPVRPVGPPVRLAIRAISLQPVLSRLGADLAAAQAAPRFEAKSLAGAQLRVRARVRTVERRIAPNTVGILEGSDPPLRNEYVVFSAHMDHVGIAGPRGSGGCRAQGADSICNGADDDGSGTVAVVEIAEAFARLQPRPKRSIIFLTVSGEEKGLWGSDHFAEHPPVPMNAIVANLNIDMIGRNWKDTIVAIGREHSDLGTTLDRVAARHPELDMKPINDPWPDQNFYFRSDHYNFARKGVPILFFFSGTHEDYHQPGDSPDRIDFEKESRVAQLIFYLGLEVANAPERPKWNPDSYRRMVSGN